MGFSNVWAAIPLTYPLQRGKQENYLIEPEESIDDRLFSNIRPFQQKRGEDLQRSKHPPEKSCGFDPGSAISCFVTFGSTALLSGPYFSRG